MLRRKLLMVHGSLVVLLLLAAVSAIVVLNSVLSRFEAINATVLEQSRQATTLNNTLSTIETELNALRRRDQTRLDALLEAADDLGARIDDLEHGTAPAPALRSLLAELTDHVDELATRRDPEDALAHFDMALEATARMRQVLAVMGGQAQERVEADRAALTTRFRWYTVAIGILFLAVINISIVVLLRAAAMVIRPVDELVDASRRLACEQFDHRVELDQDDEFGELARATNLLAEQLERNEQRKLETLHQVARTLNHELNNALSIIELQLEMVARTAHGDPDQTDRLQQIRQTLERMAGTVDALKRIRRIVLTDYTAGVKMLDLERSVEADPAAAGAEPTMAQTKHA